MPPRFVYWTILIDNQPTAFRALQREDLLPTLTQLRRTNKEVTVKYFSHGRLWDSQEQAREGQRRPEGDEKRGRDWRPGGKHQDPRARFDSRKKAAGPQSSRGDRLWNKPQGKPPGRKAGDQRPWSNAGRSGEARKPWQPKGPQGPRGAQDSHPQGSHEASRSGGPQGARTERPWNKPKGSAPWQKQGDRRPWSNAGRSGEGRKPWQPKGPQGSPAAQGSHDAARSGGPQGARSERPWSKPKGSAPWRQEGDQQRPWNNAGRPGEGRKPWQPKESQGPRGDRPWSKPEGKAPWRKDGGHRPWSSTGRSGERKPWHGKPQGQGGEHKPWEGGRKPWEKEPRSSQGSSSDRPWSAKKDEGRPRQDQRTDRQGDGARPANSRPWTRKPHDKKPGPPRNR